MHCHKPVEQATSTHWIPCVRARSPWHTETLARHYFESVLAEEEFVRGWLEEND